MKAKEEKMIVIVVNIAPIINLVNRSLKSL